MTQMLRRGALTLVVSLPLLAGCATDGCEYLAYEDGVPTESRALTIPQGVQAPPESGTFSIPSGETATPSGRCMAEPPLILPPDVLVEPEEEA